MIRNENASKLILALVVGTTALMAAPKTDMHKEYHHHVVLQIDSKKPQTRKMSLNNVNALMNYFGKNDVEVEVVIYGNKTGIDMAFEGSKLSKRINKMAQNKNIRFSACGNSKRKYEKRTGTHPNLLKGVKLVPSAVGRITELQEEGYTYLHP